MESIGQKNQFKSEQQLETEERDRRSAVLVRFMETARGIDCLDGKTIAEVFSSEENRRQLISKLNDEQYIELIIGLNGILRGKNKEEWQADGVGVTAVGFEARGAHIFPRQRDKIEILNKVWEAAKSMNDNGRSLEDIAMLLGSLLVETHPFGDGNGRTSRAVYSLTKNGYSKETIGDLSIMLGREGRYDGADMALSKQYVNKIFERKYGRLSPELNRFSVAMVWAYRAIDDIGRFKSIKFPEGVSEELKSELARIADSDLVNTIFLSAVLNFAKKEKINLEPFTQEFPTHRNLILGEFIESLDASQIEKLMNEYWDTNKQYVESLIDIFISPQKLEYRIERDGEEMSTLDFFKKRIENKDVLQ